MKTDICPFVGCGCLVKIWQKFYVLQNSHKWTNLGFLHITTADFMDSCLHFFPEFEF
jgi:hypothetical protein